MRLAVMIIALCLVLLIGVQSCTTMVGATLLEDEATTGAGAIGVFLAFIFILAAALVWAFPRASGVLFLLGGGLALLAGLSSKFNDLVIWGGVSLALSLMAFLGSRELRRANRHPSYPSRQGHTGELAAVEFHGHPDDRGMHPVLIVLITLFVVTLIAAAFSLTIESTNIEDADQETTNVSADVLPGEPASRVQPEPVTGDQVVEAAPERTEDVSIDQAPAAETENQYRATIDAAANKQVIMSPFEKMMDDPSSVAEVQLAIDRAVHSGRPERWRALGENGYAVPGQPGQDGCRLVRVSIDSAPAASIKPVKRCSM